jgi:hypothetical protein
MSTADQSNETVNGHFSDCCIEISDQKFNFEDEVKQFLFSAVITYYKL